MRVLLLWDPDEKCVDPKDHHQEGRRHYDEVPTDAIVIYETLRDPDEPDGHVDVTIAGSGIYENITIEGVQKALLTLKE